MSESLFSAYWYRVAKLKPQLGNATVVTRQVYRGQPWYVLISRVNGRHHRFNAAAYRFIGWMDGRRTMQEIWDNSVRRPDEEQPTQDEVIGLLSRLHDADLIQSDILPSTVDLARKVRGASPGSWKARVTNPFSFRFPIWDPDRFLEKWSFMATPLFTRSALMLWLGVIFSAVIAAGLHWPDLTGSLSDRLLSPSNLLLLWLVYPVMKVLHEFGHAFAVKNWGGEVHEMGIVLFALTPIAYINASASASFPDKRQRMVVAGMGVAVELLLASLALFVWLNVEPGLIRVMAFNVILIGGTSSLLINGNPLLHYDGYYILSDLIEIPNLGQRSNRYLGYLIRRCLLGVETAQSPVTASGEPGWFMVYGPVAFCYRMVVLIGLVLLVSSRFLGIGLLIAAGGVVNLVIIPSVRTVTRFLNSPEAVERRSRLVGLGSLLAVGVGLLFLILPIPLRTTTQGVVWLPEQSLIRAGSDCEVVTLLTPGEQIVAKDVPLIKGADPFLESRIEVCKARLEELYATYNAQPLYERVKRRMLQDEIEAAKADLHNAEEKQDHLLIRSPARGRFVLIDAHHLVGRFVKKGELLGYVIADHRPIVRAVVRQADIGLVRKGITGVAVRLAECAGTTLTAAIDRLVPAAEGKLPSAALGTSGGGDIPVDPTDPEGLRPLDTIFHLDIKLPQEVKNPHIGGRVYVRLEHGTMPLAMQWYRSLRQLLLRRFYV